MPAFVEIQKFIPVQAVPSAGQQVDKQFCENNTTDQERFRRGPLHISNIAIPDRMIDKKLLSFCNMVAKTKNIQYVCTRIH